MQILAESDELVHAALLGPVVELKFIGDGLASSGVVEGYAATFGSVDHHGDSIVPGAFQASLAEHHAAGTAPAMLWHHRGAEPIGRWVAMGEDARGLRVRGQLNLETSRGRDAHAHLKAGDIGGLSIGYTVPSGGQDRGPNGTRLLKRIALHEVSVTSIPADPSARVSAVKSLVNSRAELEDRLSELFHRGAARKMAGPAWAALSSGVGVRSEQDDDPLLVELSKKLDAALYQLKSLKRT